MSNYILTQIKIIFLVSLVEKFTLKQAKQSKARVSKAFVLLMLLLCSCSCFALLMVLMTQ